MKLVTKEEAAKMKLKTGRALRLRTQLLKMKVGEIMLVEKSEVKSKEQFFSTVYRLNYEFNSHYQCSTIETGEGWLVERDK